MPPKLYDGWMSIAPEERAVHIAQLEQKIQEELSESDAFLKSALDNLPEMPLDLEKRVLEIRLSLIDNLCVRYKKAKNLDNLEKESKAEKYDQRFTPEETLLLLRCNIRSEVANAYHPLFTGAQITYCFNRGFLPQAYDQEQQKRYHRLLQRLMYHEAGDSAFPKIASGMTYLDSFYFLGVGAHSLVVQAKMHRYAYKFTMDGFNERQLLLRLLHHGEPRNVVRIEKDLGDYLLRLEYITGRTIQQVVGEENKVPSEQVLCYSADIFNGLLELRTAGIWHHRDLRPANIMIEEKKNHKADVCYSGCDNSYEEIVPEDERNRAVIIDLGIATTDRDALVKDNRRFGSPRGQTANDLNSLGQIIYKMATGEHIFAESKSMERTTYADKLRDHRDWIYERPEERLPPYLRRVEETVKDSGLCGIVKFCLTSEGTDEDYKTLEVRFKEYGN